jgi:isopenicillin N synthase-like dioxygenase
MESACPKALALAERFFSEVSQESKEKIHMKNSKYFRGYEPASYSSVNDFTTHETKEAFNWGMREVRILLVVMESMWSWTDQRLRV